MKIITTILLPLLILSNLNSVSAQNNCAQIIEIQKKSISDLNKWSQNYTATINEFLENKDLDRECLTKLTDYIEDFEKEDIKKISDNANKYISNCEQILHSGQGQIEKLLLINAYNYQVVVKTTLKDFVALSREYFAKCIKTTIK